MLQSIDGFKLDKTDEYAGTPDPLNPLFRELDFPDQTTISPIQLWQRYILLPGVSELLIIDQRAAHERIIYESMMKDLALHNPAVQKLLWPETIQCNASDAVLLQELLPDLQYLGFDIAAFGHGSYIIHGVPAIITDLIAPQQAIDDILDRFKTGREEIQMKPVERIASSLAFNLSRKRGDTLSSEEMQKLIERLMACENPYSSPSGRKTFITVGKEEMFRRFQS